MKRTIIKFALFPVKLSSGEWVWFTVYKKIQQWQKVLKLHEMGWPDRGYYDYEDEWVTIKKELA